jgi:hypothetical protein
VVDNQTVNKTNKYFWSVSPKQVWSWYLVVWESCFLSVMWRGEALYGLGVQDVRVLLLVGGFCLPSVAPVSQQNFWFAELTCLLPPSSHHLGFLVCSASYLVSQLSQKHPSPPLRSASPRNERKGRKGLREDSPRWAGSLPWRSTALHDVRNGWKGLGGFANMGGQPRKRSNI